MRITEEKHYESFVRELHKQLIDDVFINQLIGRKVDIINKIDYKMVLDIEKQQLIPIYTNEELELLNHIDELIEQR